LTSGRQLRAVLLATSVEAHDADALREQGIEVHVLEQPPSLRELAGAALELRKRHPNLPLLVAGPPKLVRQFERRYPPLIDVALASTSAATVLSGLATSQT